MPSRTQLIATSVGLAAVTGVVGYAIYFDYKRRNDADFRKKLKKEHKKVHMSSAKEAKANKEKTTKLLKAHLATIAQEPLPTTPDAREQYFMENVAIGEGLAAAGPLNEIPAALAFYRALRVYPSPVELIMIYQKTVPAPIFALLMELTSLDIAGEQAGAATRDSAGASGASKAGTAGTLGDAPTNSASSTSASAESGELVDAPSSDNGTNGEWESVHDAPTTAGDSATESAAAAVDAETLEAKAVEAAELEAAAAQAQAEAAEAQTQVSEEETKVEEESTSVETSSA